MNRADSEVTPKRMLACRVTPRPIHIDTRLRSFRVATTARRLEQLLFLAFLAAVVTASGQAPTWNPLTKMPPEKYDNPPAYIYRLDTSPWMISPHGAFTSYQVNVDTDSNNIVGDAANEPSISQDPNNPHRRQSAGDNSIHGNPISAKAALAIQPTPA